MTPLRLFVSSVQREFAAERAALRDYLRGDPLMRRYFEAFLFEDVPATDRRPDALYLDEVERCDLYVGLFGREYGSEDDDGVSPTEREFDRAKALGKHRLIFVRGGAGDGRHPRMQALIDRAQADLVRRRFNTPADLVAGLYAALVEYLEGRELLRWGPFDAAPCTDATFDDLDRDRMTAFIGAARRARQFPLAEGAAPEALLEHLNLLNRRRLTHAAVLLFGKRPQRFLISSAVKCAHFHGTRVGKPIPSHQVYEGTVFELVDHAVDFVLSKIALSVGTRAESVQAPVAYEIPKEVVTEAIVNAVAHRDYTSAASVQVMLFADRLEVWNPGTLPPPLTLDKLRVPHESLPGNPLLARAMYLVQYIEQMGTGTLDMIERCVDAGLREPEFEASGNFVIRIRRAAPAGQPVVFTDGEDVRRRTRRGTAAQPESSAALPERTSTDTGASREPTQKPAEKPTERAAPAERPVMFTDLNARGSRAAKRGTTLETGATTTQEIGTTTQETGATTQEAAQESRAATQERILDLLRAEPAISRRVLAKRIGITPDGVKYHLTRLRAAGVVRHVGPTKGGRWEVLE